MTTTEKKAPRRTRNRQPLASGPEAVKVAAADAKARAAKTPPKMDATGAFVDPSERRRRTVREPRQQAAVSVGSRRCTGSRTFDIEAHEAPVSDFPVQPSRKDGLGTMCKPHWKEYTSALRKAAIARQAGATDATDGGPAPTRRTRAAAPAPDVDPALAAAKALVDEVDRMPADEASRRVGDDDVQAALETVAKASLG